MESERVPMKLYTDLCVGFLTAVVTLLAILGLVTLVRALAGVIG